MLFHRRSAVPSRNQTDVLASQYNWIGLWAKQSQDARPMTMPFVIVWSWVWLITYRSITLQPLWNCPKSVMTHFEDHGITRVHFNLIIVMSVARLCFRSGENSPPHVPGTVAQRDLIRTVETTMSVSNFVASFHVMPWNALVPVWEGGWLLLRYQHCSKEVTADWRATPLVGGGGYETSLCNSSPYRFLSKRGTSFSS